MDGDRLISVLTFVGVLVLLILALTGCEPDRPPQNEQVNVEEPVAP